MNTASDSLAEVPFRQLMIKKIEANVKIENLGIIRFLGRDDNLRPHADSRSFCDLPFWKTTSCCIVFAKDKQGRNAKRITGWRWPNDLSKFGDFLNVRFFQFLMGCWRCCHITVHFWPKPISWGQLTIHFWQSLTQKIWPRKKTKI